MRALRALLGQRARLRWLHLILGGALFMPYWLVGTVVVGPLGGGGLFAGSLAWQLAAYGVGLPLAAVTALFPLTRPMSVAAVRALCGVPAELLADSPARDRGAKARTAAWYTLHVGIGALVSGATLALPPFAVAVTALPFSPGLRESELGAFWGLGSPFWIWTAPAVGPLMLLALAAAAAAAGALLARQAPRLLGPGPAERLAAAERRAAEAEARNRLARELHDSVGHALSAVTLQAGAARRVLDAGRDRTAPDLEFVREALAAVEETARRTVGELDTVLGLLRRGEEEAAAAGGGPGLDALDALVRGSGPRVALTVTGDIGGLGGTLSREAYRIVQEGLTNAARHAGGDAPVTVRLDARSEDVEITVENPLPDGPPVTRPGGGHGLRGVAERARLLGGTAEAGPADGVWRLAVRLPR